MTEPTRPDDDPAALAHDRADEERSDESRDISDVGLPRPGDDEPVDAAAAAEADEAALDEVFPPAD